MKQVCLFIQSNKWETLPDNCFVMVGIDFSFTRCDSRYVATIANNNTEYLATIQTIYLMFSGADASCYGCLEYCRLNSVISKLHRFPRTHVWHLDELKTPPENSEQGPYHRFNTSKINSIETVHYHWKASVQRSFHSGPPV